MGKTDSLNCITSHGSQINALQLPTQINPLMSNLNDDTKPLPDTANSNAIEPNLHITCATNDDIKSEPQAELIDLRPSSSEDYKKPCTTKHGMIKTPYIHPDLIDIQIKPNVFHTAKEEDLDNQCSNYSGDFSRKENKDADQSHENNEIRSEHDLINFDDNNFSIQFQGQTSTTNKDKSQDFSEIFFKQNTETECRGLPAPLSPEKFEQSNELQSLHVQNEHRKNGDKIISKEYPSGSDSSLNADYIHINTNHNNLSDPIHINKVTAKALVDTGACISTISAQFWREQLQPDFPKFNTSNLTQIKTVSGDALNILGQLEIPCIIGDNNFTLQAYITEGVTFDIILGRDFLQKHKAKIDLNTNKIEFETVQNSFPFSEYPDISDPDDYNTVSSVHADKSFILQPNSETIFPAHLEIKLPEGAIGIVSPRQELPEKHCVFGASEIVKVSDCNTIPIRIKNPSAKPIRIYRRTKLADFTEVEPNIATYELKEKVGENLPEEASNLDINSHDYSAFPHLDEAKVEGYQMTQLKQLLFRYKDIFAYSLKDIGRTSIIEHTIDTGNHPPVCSRPYRTSPQNREEIDRQVDQLLELKLIQPSTSAYASPVVLVRKPDGTMRFCIDYRKLNKSVAIDRFPIPLIAETLDALHGTQFFSTLDLRSGFWQIPLDKSSRAKTAFITHRGLYEWTTLITFRIK